MKSKLSDRQAFHYTINVNFVILVVDIRLALFLLERFSLSLALQIVLLLIFVVAMTALSYKLTSSKLKQVAYSYGNLYLFRRYTFLYEVIFTTAITFLLGAFPVLVEQAKYNNTKVIFRTNIGLILLSCFTAANKCFLEYIETIWQTQGEKKGIRMLE